MGRIDMVRVVSSEDADITFRKRSVPGVPFFVIESAAEAMVQAADEDALDDSETLGLMVGRVYRDESGQYAVAERTITSERLADATGVRFDPDDMSELIDGVDGMEDGERIIGWYHSHLGCGCFMSDTDVRTQHSVFGGGMGFAIVIDPLRGEFAVFDNSETPEKVQMIIVQ